MSEESEYWVAHWDAIVGHQIGPVGRLIGALKMQVAELKDEVDRLQAEDLSRRELDSQDPQAI